MKLAIWLPGITAVSLVAGRLALTPPEPAAAAQVKAPTTREELGRLLFWDQILSGDGTVACATCHHPDFAYTDGRDLPLGVGGIGLGPERVDVSAGQFPMVKRNSPTILNVVFNGFEERRGRRNGAPVGPEPTNQLLGPMFWDRRVDGLEAQALEPLKSQEEMRGNAYPEAVAVDSVMARLRAIPEYVGLFSQVFGPENPITPAHFGEAIAAFERTLTALNSPFDRYRRGDTSALTAQQIRGEDEFDDVGCDRCHEGLLFSDFDLRTLGVAESAKLTTPDEGAGRFRFRTPSLRNVTLTAPYMHNGALATLQDVLRFYDEGRSENPNVSDGRGGNGNRANGIARVDGAFRRVDNLSDREMADIIAFLEALTDDGFDRTIPASVPSGLTPGGTITPTADPQPLTRR
jgi:cytochrome c peroxidase